MILFYDSMKEGGEASPTAAGQTKVINLKSKLHRNKETLPLSSGRGTVPFLLHLPDGYDGFFSHCPRSPGSRGAGRRGWPGVAGDPHRTVTARSRPSHRAVPQDRPTPGRAGGLCQPRPLRACRSARPQRLTGISPTSNKNGESFPKHPFFIDGCC